MRVGRVLVAAALVAGAAFAALAALGTWPRPTAICPAGATLQGRVALQAPDTAARVTLWRVAPHQGERENGARWWLRDPERTALERFVRDDVQDGALDCADDGAFAWRYLAPGLYRVTARTPGGLAGTSAVLELRNGERVHVALGLRPARETLRGRVLGVGALEPPVRVLATVLAMPWYLPSDAGPGPIAVDAEGRFTIEDLPKGLVTVAVADARGLRVVGQPIELPRATELEVQGDPDLLVVEGQVVASPGREPIAGARVMAWPARGDTGLEALVEGLTGPTTVADEAGRFRLRMPKAGWTLVGQSAGFLPGHARPAPSATLALARSATLRGRLIEAGGARPLAGVSVYAYQEDSWDPPCVATSDAEGRYRLVGLKAGPTQLVARGAGWISPIPKQVEGETSESAYDVALEAGGEVVHDLALDPATRVRGQVLDAAGAPVVGAAVRAVPAKRSGARQRTLWLGLEEAITGPDGFFEVVGLTEGFDYELRASVPDAPAPPMRRARAGVDAPQTAQEHLVLRVPASRWVWVRVVAAANEAPVAGAHVSLAEVPTREAGSADDESHFRSLGWVSVGSGTTDAEGWVRLGPAGPGALWAEADGEGFATLDRVEVALSTTVRGEPGAVLRLERARPLRGRVLQHDGRPAEGARIGLLVDMQGGKGRGLSTLARAEGRFTFEHVPEGTLTLRATLTGEDGTERTARIVDVPRDEDAVLTLSAGLQSDTLVVRVLDPQGAPVDAAHVEFWVEEGAVHMQDAVAGHATFTLDEPTDPGGVEGAIVVEKARDVAGAALPLGRTRLEGVRTGRVVEVQMVPEQTIEGRIVDGEGRGVRGVKVRAEPASAGESHAWMEEPGHWSYADAVLSDEQGRFRVGQLGAGPHRVLILPPHDFAPGSSLPAAAGARDLHFTLRPAAQATVRVRDGADRPVSGARVVVTLADDTHQEIRIAEALSRHTSGIVRLTDERGEALVRGLDPQRTYILGIAPPLARTDLAEHVEPRWRPGDLTLALGVGHVVTGRVLDRWGKPVAHAIVSCRRASGVETRTSTDEQGAFRFESVPAGGVELEALLWEGGRAGRTDRRSSEVRADAGDTDVVLWL